ncbi:hypothetical protein GY45DRAFT_1081242 [Cubamyces sp. BRFM 1775]|nr:hypothetical protein GY45DRAFT_1081242 [Cubamyces sp. BRFM 1775]
MPTVPPKCVPVDAYSPLPAVSALSEAALFGPDERIAGPTPDPDTDDVVLVPVEQGNAVSQDLLAPAPPQTSEKPGRIDLGSLNLHSPSSIVGTPFDISPRFEYPFPPATCSPPFPSFFEFDPSMASFPYPALSTSIPSAPPVVPPVSIPSYPLPPIAVGLPGRARAETRSFSPTHPRLQPRDPPVPPSLVKKRRLNHNQSVAADAPQLPKAGPAVGRPRAGSLSSLPEHLQRLAGAEAGEDRGRGEIPAVDRCQGEKDRSQSLDMQRRRIPLERHPSDVTVVDHDSGVKPPLSHASSSSTLIPPDYLDNKTAAVEDAPPRSVSPSPASSPRSSLDGARDTAPVPLPASPPPSMPSSLDSPGS